MAENIVGDPIGKYDSRFVSVKVLVVEDGGMGKVDVEYVAILKGDFGTNSLEQGWFLRGDPFLVEERSLTRSFMGQIPLR